MQKTAERLTLSGVDAKSRYVKEWVVINNGAGKPYPLRINHADTNGTVNDFYWNEADSTLGRHTLTDTIMRNFSTTEIRYPGFPMWIYGRDDDSLLAGGKFVVFADSAPPAPVAALATTQPGMPNIKIQWQGMDAKDDSLTQYAIVLGSSPAALNDTLVKFLEGKNSIFGKVNGKFTYQFNPDDAARTPHYSTDFYFRVIARDSRKSVSTQGNSYTPVSYPY